MLDPSLRSGGGRVILLEDDVGLREVLLELFSDEGFEVDACMTLDEIYAALQQHPCAVVVADSWTACDYVELSQGQRMEIEALGRTAPLILTTGRAWGRQIDRHQLPHAMIVVKPYDLGDLLERVGQARRPFAAECGTEETET
jgi:DNA-binding response OmpR family regulator